MTERTDHALIRKHGFRKWFECRMGLQHGGLKKGDGNEDKIVASFINCEHEDVIDLGCANSKTLPKSIGVDMIKKGDKVPNLNAISEADVVADVEFDMPFEQGSKGGIVARHILEHCLDPIQTINNWKKYLRKGGRLVIAVPDERQFKSIALNVEHLHAYTPDSLKNLGEACGLKFIGSEVSNSSSFVTAFEQTKQVVTDHETELAAGIKGA